MPVSSIASSRFSDRDVTLLVDMVRLSRVTLLVAEPGSEKSLLLRSTVMPLLNQKKLGSPGGEIAILFDEWDKAPLSALHARIRQCVGAAGVAVPPPGSGSLMENLEMWQESMSETFLIVLDRFEAFLRAPRDSSSTAEFETAFVHIANDPTLRVNFLLAIDQDAEPLLAHLRRHIPRLGYSSVRLPGAGAAAAGERDRHPSTELHHTAHAVPAAPLEERHQGAKEDPAPAPSPDLRSPVRTPAVLLRPAEATQRPNDSMEAPSAVQPVAREIRQGSAELSEPKLDENDRTAEIPEQSLASTPIRKRRLSRFAWVPTLLIASIIAYLLWQPQFEELAQRISAPRADEIIPPKPAPSEVPPPLTVPSRADAPTRAPEPPPAAEAVARKSMPPARTEPAEPAPAEAPAALAPPTRTRDLRKPDTAAKAPPATAASSDPQSPTRELRKPEALAAKAPEPLPKPVPGQTAKPPVPARDAVVAVAPPAIAPNAAPAQRAANETPSGPVLRINVRSEAQRAWAKQMIGPLRERGIHVASIRMVPPHGDIAHIRYYRAAERTEAMRVAAALSDLGLSARQLKHMDEMASSAPARQYEVWFAADEKR